RGCGRAFTPSPRYSGERGCVRVTTKDNNFLSGTNELRLHTPRVARPSPRPSPLSAGEREQTRARLNVPSSPNLQNEPTAVWVILWREMFRAAILRPIEFRFTKLYKTRQSLTGSLKSSKRTHGTLGDLRSAGAI